MKSQTFKENKDFRRLYYRGKSKASACLVTYALKNKSGECRLGITTSKKIGGAVQRNRARRVIRSAFSSLEGYINGGWDFVFVARSKTCNVKMQDVRRDMLCHFKELGVVNEETQ